MLKLSVQGSSLKVKSSKFKVQGSRERMHTSRFPDANLNQFIPLAVMLGVLTIPAGPACAALLGDTLKPFASVTEMYDSNVFRVKDREQLRLLVGDDRMGDFTTQASVGTAIHYTLSRQELDLLYRHDFIRFAHYTGQDVDQDTASGSLKLTILDRLRITADGSYSKTPQPRADYQSTGQNEVTNIAGGVTVGYEMVSGVGFDAAYRRINVDYSLPQFSANQYGVNSYSGTLFYRISPETKIYGTYQRDDTTYGEQLPLGPVSVDNSNVSDSFRVGLYKSFSPRTAVSGYVGFLNRRHNAASARDFSGPIGKAEISYGLTAKLGLVLNWERQIHEETYTDRIYSVNDAVGAGLVCQISEKLKGTLMDRVTWKGFADLPGSGVVARSDFINDLNTGLEWVPINRLTVSLNYGFSTRNSDDDSFDFSDHAVTVGLSYKY